MHFTGLTAKPTASDLTKAEMVCDVKSIPALGGAPEQLETTTLSSSVQTFVNGVKQLDQFEFTANYIKSVYRKINELEKKGSGEWWAVVLGADADGNPDGHDGIMVWQGGITCAMNEQEVNAVREMTIYISATTAPEMLADAQ